MNMTNKIWGYALIGYSIFAGLLIYIVYSSPDNPDDAFNLVKRMGVFAYILDLLILTPLYFLYKKMKRNKTETLIYQSEP